MADVVNGARTSPSERRAAFARGVEKGDATIVMDVLKPGMSSTFQDLGRVGHQKLGVPVSGAMDEVSHCMANWLVRNDAHEATLEITVFGPWLRFDRDVLIALAGAELCAEIVGGEVDAEGGSDAPTEPEGVERTALSARPVVLHTPTRLPAGAILRFGRRVDGARAYLAVQGGFGLPTVLGSCSTYARGSLGGLRGRALLKGDRLAIPDRGRHDRTRRDDMARGREAHAALERLLDDLEPGRLRAIPGREWTQFDAASRTAFFRDPFVIGPQSERMGYRLAGPRLARDHAVDMLSEAVAFGTVQVPNDGQPIVLMADRQSTGGYPRIAQVAGVDLPRLAQMMPGEKLRFEPIDIDEAQRLLAHRGALLETLRVALCPASKAARVDAESN